jgi:beta-phosphoglucomutase
MHSIKKFQIIRMIRGVLFDMDGVLVDSEKYIFEATKTMFAEHGIEVKPEHALNFVGMGENKYISGIGEMNGFKVDIERDKARTYAIYEQITHGKLRALPGVYDFIKQCQYKGLKMAIASSADQVKILINLREIGLDAHLFQAIVNGQDVERKKPFPDIYLLASEKLGLHPAECLVVEDAVSGVSAAKSAGAKCLALTTSFPAEKITEADWICKDLSDIPEALNF